jgi:hypothetical protein
MLLPLLIKGSAGLVTQRKFHCLHATCAYMPAALDHSKIFNLFALVVHDNALAERALLQH